MKTMSKFLVLFALGLLVLGLTAATVAPGDFPWRTVAAKKVVVDKGTTTKTVTVNGMKKGNSLGVVFLGYGDLTYNPSAAYRTSQLAYATTTTAPVLPNMIRSTTDTLVVMKWAAATPSTTTLELLYLPGR
jgi:hypothetical protein